MKIKAKIAEKQHVIKKIDTDFIRLDAFLKLCDAVQTGGNAKSNRFFIIFWIMRLNSVRMTLLLQ